MLEAAITLLTGIVIAVVSAWITVQLSLRRFRTERWWERKAQAYERVIAALHDSKAFAEEHLYADTEGRQLSEEQTKELLAQSKVAHEEIAKAMDMGAFLLSDETLSRLRQYKKDEGKASEAPIWSMYLEADWDAADRCLKELVLIAKRDLQVK